MSGVVNVFNKKEENQELTFLHGDLLVSCAHFCLKNNTNFKLYKKFIFLTDWGGQFLLMIVS